MRTTLKLTLLVCAYWIFTAATCSVKMVNTSIPPTISTYYVKPFANTALNAPPDIGNTFSEKLKDQIRQQSRLTYTDVNPDIEFEGNVQGFNITSVAPTLNETTQLSRLRITVKVDYFDNQDEENNWTQNFFFEQDYPADQNISDIQEQLIDDIFEQLTTDVFNKAFGKW